MREWNIDDTERDPCAKTNTDYSEHGEKPNKNRFG
jgi:hypothetical protein